MARDGERSRAPDGVTRAAALRGELEQATEHGGGLEETDDLPFGGSPGDSAIDPTFAVAMPSVLDEQELPRREGSPRSAPEGRAIASDPEVGDVVGDYELVAQLGRGGAGAVFRASSRTTGEVVALKVLAASKVKRARIVQRFFDEVRAASAVQHPGLIRVLDFIEEEEPRRLAYAMEYVDGESLRERLRRDGTLDLREAIHVGAEVTEALAALHDAGIIHRDLKPENIMLLRAAPGSMPSVKLLDFGVVKFLPADRASAQSSAVGDDRPGTFVGTPRYMAPEQAAGGSVDPRADLFAVGVLLFEMITGVCPHEGDSLRDVVLAKLKGAPRITVNPEKEILPHELTEVVDACLQLKPAVRPKSAREVARGLREASVVLFTVGAVKTDESGVPFRLVSQLPQGSMGPSVGGGAHGASMGPSVLGAASPASPVSPAELPARPDLPTPGVHPGRPGSLVTVRPAPGPLPPTVTPAALPGPAVRPSSPSAPRAPDASAPPRRGVGLGRGALPWVLAALMLAVIAVLVAALVARSVHDEQVLLVPLEAPIRGSTATTATTARAAGASGAGGGGAWADPERPPAEAEAVLAPPPRPTADVPADVRATATATATAP